MLSLFIFFCSCTELEPNSNSTNNNKDTSNLETTPQTHKMHDDQLSTSNKSTNSDSKETTAPEATTLLKTRAMPKVKKSYSFPYDLENPDFKGNLPKAINDEAGRLYTIDPEDCSLLEKKKFGKDGDYEGLAIVGNIVYVVEANGNITPIDIRKPKVKKTIKTSLTTANDVEGLCFDPATNELVLACKGTPALKKKHKLKNTKAFYAFDLNRKELNDYPKFTINDGQLEEHFKHYLDDDLSKKQRKKLKNRLLNFSPSAIAKHPIEENFYILSSIGRLLLICNNHGRITDIQFLNSKKFSQPEGICFAPDGTLFISNEGRSVKGTVMRFGMLR